MIAQIKKIIINLIAGANIVTICLMLLSGYSDRLQPDISDLIACAGMAFPLFVLANLLFIPVWVFLSWPRLLIPVIGLILAYSPIRTYMPLHGKPSIGDDALLVISYNVCGFGGNYKYENGLDTVFNYLKAQKPDIVCLQEAYSGKRRDAQKVFSEYFAYCDTTKVSKDDRLLINCLGIYTRFPILRKEVIDYNSTVNGSVVYYLLINGDTVAVINNHLETTHLNTADRNRYQEMLKGGVERDTMKAEATSIIHKLANGMTIRAQHANIIHHYVDSIKQRYPIILCGDFNDTPISYARHRIAEGLTDCFVESGQGLGLSFNRSGFNLRIDHMMCSDDFIPYYCKIDNKMDASDHYPLLCWLKTLKNVQ